MFRYKPDPGSKVATGTEDTWVWSCGCDGCRDQRPKAWHRTQDLTLRAFGLPRVDDFSRFIIAWKLCTTMKSSDVTETLNMALEASGCDSAKVIHKPRLLSDNGSSYISGELAKWLGDKGMDHTRGAPMHPQTQGKIERWHQTLKNRILLENYYLPGDLEQKIADFVSHYNHLRYHESIANLTPADVYFGRGQNILLERERIKHQTFKTRRLLHRNNAA